MKVENYTQDAKTDYRNEMKRMDEANRRLVQNKEKQIENLEKNYNKKADTVRSIGEERLLALRDQLNQKQQAEMSSNEELLSKYKGQLAETQQQLEAQREQLTLAQKEQIKNQQLNFSDMINSRQDELSEQTREINDRTNNQVHDVINESNYQVSDQNFKAKTRIDQAIRDNDNKMRAQARISEIKQKDEALKQYQESANVKLAHDRELGQQAIKSNTEFTQREANFQKQLEGQNSFYSQKLKDQHEAFKQKFANLTSEQETLVKSVTERFQKEVEGMVSSNAIKKRELASKLDDDFYHVSTIDPKLVETEKSYQISIPLPEHEKDGARLTAHDRVVRLNFTRNFEDQVQDDAGNTHKSKRSEIMSKEFKVDSIVESKKITQNYTDGVLTFVLPKK